MQHLPRHGLQPDRSNRYDAHERRDEHRCHSGLERDLANLLELLPRIEVLVDRK
jgi:hypothetical protein